MAFEATITAIARALALLAGQNPDENTLRDPTVPPRPALEDFRDQANQFVTALETFVANELKTVDTAVAGVVGAVAGAAQSAVGAATTVVQDVTAAATPAKKAGKAAPDAS